MPILSFKSVLVIIGSTHVRLLNPEGKSNEPIKQALSWLLSLLGCKLDTCKYP